MGRRFSLLHPSPTCPSSGTVPGAPEPQDFRCSGARVPRVQTPHSRPYRRLVLKCRRWSVRATEVGSRNVEVSVDGVRVVFLAGDPGPLSPVSSSSPPAPTSSLKSLGEGFLDRVSERKGPPRRSVREGRRGQDRGEGVVYCPCPSKWEKLWGPFYVLGVSRPDPQRPRTTRSVLGGVGRGVWAQGGSGVFRRGTSGVRPGHHSPPRALPCLCVGRACDTVCPVSRLPVVSSVRLNPSPRSQRDPLLSHHVCVSVRVCTHVPPGLPGPNRRFVHPQPPSPNLTVVTPTTCPRPGPPAPRVSLV